MSQETSQGALPKLPLLPFSWGATVAHARWFPYAAGIVGGFLWWRALAFIRDAFDVQIGFEASPFPQLAFFTFALVLLCGVYVGILFVRHLLQQSAVPSSYLRQVQDTIMKKHGVTLADEEVRLVLTLQAMDKHPFEDLVDGEILYPEVMRTQGDVDSVPVQLVYEMDEKSYRLEKVA